MQPVTIDLGPPRHLPPALTRSPSSQAVARLQEALRGGSTDEPFDDIVHNFVNPPYDGLVLPRARRLLRRIEQLPGPTPWPLCERASSALVTTLAECSPSFGSALGWPQVDAFVEDYTRRTAELAVGHENAASMSGLTSSMATLIPEDWLRLQVALVLAEVLPSRALHALAQAKQETETPTSDGTVIPKLLHVVEASMRHKAPQIRQRIDALRDSLLMHTSVTQTALHYLQQRTSPAP